MQLILRYVVRDKIKEKEVTIENARFHYRKLKRKHYLVDFIFIDDKGIEYCIA